MKKRMPIFALVCLIAAFGLLAMALFFAVSITVPAGKNAEERVIRIEKGSSATEVASLLHRENLIRSSSLFQIFMRLGGTDKKLKAGTYRILPGTSMPAIATMLSEGRTYQIQVTIPEGSTMKRIADLLEKAKICSGPGFLASATDKSLAAKAGIPAKNFEGFLFPDTYLFAENSDPEVVVMAMAQNFFKKLESIAPSATKDRGTLYADVVLASIVEREYRIPAEAGLMASVFKNRLSIKMALQSCATVVYIITEKLGKPHPSVVYYSDLAIDDPYNTYIHRGLPPGPISNPGETALRAVFNSPQSDYLYFRLVDESAGVHRFSRTFEEHTGETIPVKGF